MKLVLGLALLLSAGVFTMACGSDDSLSDDVVGLPTAVASPTRGQGGTDLLPSIEITSPGQGDTVKGPDLTVKVDVEGFKLVDKVGQTSEPGQGHILYALDPPLTGVPDDGGGVIETSEKEVRWQNVTPGEHTLMAQLVANNGTLLQPPVVQRITVTVE
jgi:hypothetical protein